MRISDWSSDVCSSDLYDQRYPAAGTPNALVDLYVMKPDGSGKVKVDMGADPDIYLARVHWSADGDTLYVERENRDQTRLDMLVVDPATGTSRVLFSEKSRSEEHTSELQSLMRNSYAVFCLKKKKI